MADGSKLNWRKIEKRLKEIQDHPDRIFQTLK